MGVDTYKKKGLFRYSKNRYRKFEDLRIFFEELNSNIKDVEEMRKKKKEIYSIRELSTSNNQAS